jgi:hypothetical protein
MIIDRCLLKLFKGILHIREKIAYKRENYHPCFKTLGLILNFELYFVIKNASLNLKSPKS